MILELINVLFSKLEKEGLVIDYTTEEDPSSYYEVVNRLNNEYEQT
jgi:hypothetical protein